MIFSKPTWIRRPDVTSVRSGRVVGLKFASWVIDGPDGRTDPITHAANRGVTVLTWFSFFFSLSTMHRKGSSRIHAITKPPPPPTRMSNYHSSTATPICSHIAFHHTNTTCTSMCAEHTAGSVQIAGYELASIVEAALMANIIRRRTVEPVHSQTHLFYGHDWVRTYNRKTSCTSVMFSIILFPHFFS